MYTTQDRPQASQGIASSRTLEAPRGRSAVSAPSVMAAAGGLDAAVLARCLSHSLDHVGRGMVLVGAGAVVLHANRMACQALDASHPLSLEGGRLCARTTADAFKLSTALEAAMRRSLRHMLHLGTGAQRVSVAVLPIEDAGFGAALVSLEQGRGVHNLSVQCFARQHGFTAAETAVLEGLVNGRPAADIAKDKGVALSTVRTQIGQLRLKAGANSIRQLLDKVGALPPMLAVVQ